MISIDHRVCWCDVKLGQGYFGNPPPSLCFCQSGFLSVCLAVYLSVCRMLRGFTHFLIRPDLELTLAEEICWNTDDDRLVPSKSRPQPHLANLGRARRWADQLCCLCRWKTCRRTGKILVLKFSGNNSRCIYNTHTHIYIYTICVHHKMWADELLGGGLHFLSAFALYSLCYIMAADADLCNASFSQDVLSALVMFHFCGYMCILVALFKEWGKCVNKRSRV